MLNSLFDTIEKQQRVVQWGIYALVFLVGFMLWSTVLDPVRQAWADEANEIETKIAEVRRASTLAKQFTSHRDTIVALGKVDVPKTRRQATEEISRAINGILDSHRAQITDDSFQLASGRTLDKRDTTPLLGSKRAERLNGKLEFQADRLVVSQVIARLEAAEDIEAVRAVRLTHQGRDVVRAIIEFEAWVIAD